MFVRRFLLQLNKEQKLANECDTKTSFDGQRDILRRLAVFHVFQTRDDDPQEIEKGGAGRNDLFINKEAIGLKLLQLRSALPYYCIIIMPSFRSTQPSTLRGTVKWVPAKGRKVMEAYC